MISEWLSQNFVTVLGWVGGLAVFGFYFGRRLQSLEDADRNLAQSLATLTATVTTLTEAMSGANGNGALSRAIGSLSETLREKSASMKSLENRVAEHDVRLSKLDNVLVQLDALSSQMRENTSLLARIDERLLLKMGKQESV